MELNNKYLKLKDYSVSQEEFELHIDEEYEMLKTYPQPKMEALSGYYKSEDYISHTSSKRNLLERMYHLVRSISLGRKLRLVNSFKPRAKTLLDIGCGTGDFLHKVKKAGWVVTGIEPNDQARALANSKTEDVVFNSAYLNQLKENSFDVITLWHVLEHLPDLDYHTKRIKQLLKPTGTLVIAVPNFKSYDAHYYRKYWAGYDVPRHLWHFSKKSIEMLFSKHDMCVVDIQPMLFDAYYVSLLSEKYKTGTMNPLRAFWIGLQSNIKAYQSKEFSSHIYVLKHTTIQS